ncbi:cytochrome b/b6 domain-containing protein [Erythrobacter sp. T5W1-R]|uniref:cytochrome b n=1 Tax=Erythrobacter sp. T5W1-R TaxID=3101752 RepID=UPI002B002484|nr:cytochrome b/b6 domain-containing protein [Erythrobacter sp. T5W1-R]MEA1619267.1 cytochrome b/b6 domain-containing protein [Erythrobacter sp. T5W1-R]
MKFYSFAMRVMHWSAAVIIIVALTLGALLGYGVIDGRSDLGGVLYGLHISLGVIAIVIMALRLVVRQTSKRPAVKGTVAARRIAGSVHGVLYALALAVPVLGYAMDLAYGGVPSVFGIAMPDFGWLAPAGTQHPAAETLYTLHSYGGHVLAFLILAHIAAALWRTVRAAPGEVDGLRRMIGPASKTTDTAQSQP